MIDVPDESVSLIQAGIQQAGELAVLHRELFTPAWDCASFQALLEQPGALALLAVAGDQRRPIGFVLGRLVADEAEILSLGIAQDWQRRGIAAQLVAVLARLAGERGAFRIVLEVAADNDPARQLYAAQGFSEVGRRPAYYERQHGPRVDALIMAKTMSS